MGIVDLIEGVREQCKAKEDDVLFVDYEEGGRVLYSFVSELDKGTVAETVRKLAEENFDDKMHYIRYGAVTIASIFEITKNGTKDHPPGTTALTFDHFHHRVQISTSDGVDYLKAKIYYKNRGDAVHDATLVALD